MFCGTCRTADTRHVARMVFPEPCRGGKWAFVLLFGHGDLPTKQLCVWLCFTWQNQIRTTRELNKRGLASLEHVPEKLSLDFPVFVTNLAHRSDRRENTAKVLSAVGFTNFTFVHGPSWRDLDIVALQRQGKLNMWMLETIYGPIHMNRNVLPYIANTLTQLEIMQRAVDDNMELFGIFEDDLMPATTAEQTNCRITSAISQLPLTAGVDPYMCVCVCVCVCVCWCIHAYRRTHQLPHNIRHFTASSYRRCRSSSCVYQVHVCVYARNIYTHVHTYVQHTHIHKHEHARTYNTPHHTHTHTLQICYPWNYAMNLWIR
jgi:hypothetical protein